MSTSTSGLISSSPPSSNYQAMDDDIEIQGRSNVFVRTIMGRGINLHGIKAVAEAALSDVAGFALDNCGNIPQDERAKLEILKRRNLSKSMVGYGKRFLVSQPFIIVAADNEFNTSDQGKVRVTRVADINIASQVNLNSRNARIEAVSDTNTKVIVVSKNAWDSISDYFNNYWSIRLKYYKYGAIGVSVIGFLTYAYIQGSKDNA